MKVLNKLIPILIFSIFIQSCSDDEDTTAAVSTNTVVDVAIANNLTSLVAALTRADLASTLSADGALTVLAPNNKAFQDLLDSDTSWNTINDIPVETLKAVLMFHVLGSKVMSSDLSDTYINTLATRPNEEPISLQVEITGGVEFNGDAAPIAVDVEASNGIVHVINKVMLPPNVVTLAINNSAFTSLMEALTRADLTTDFVAVLSGTGPFTVFAPTNIAFQALLDSDDTWNTLADIPVETLENVLNYHVISGLNIQANQLSNGSETTLGGDITIALTNGAQIITSSDQTVNIIISDVQGTNGVIHAIDKVLIP